MRRRALDGQEGSQPYANVVSRIQLENGSNGNDIFILDQGVTDEIFYPISTGKLHLDLFLSLST